jgi:putative Mg2+ transporter-C (MgtC) family protein
MASPFRRGGRERSAPAVPELNQDIFVGLPDGHQVLRVVIRLGVAMALGGVVGLERQREGKAAGVRTHMLVALGAALFVVAAVEAGMDRQALSRVIQGLAAGIGFLGAGTILKLSEEHEVRGLTSAAGVWLTASVGAAVGLGLLWPAALGVALAWFVLGTLHVLQRKAGDRGGSHHV